MSKTEKTEPEIPTTDSPVAGGGETILADRVTALEIGMTHLVTKAEMVEVKEVLKRVVTKDELKDEMAGVRAEIAGVKDELKGEIAGVKDELKGETSGLKADMAEIKEILKHLATKDDIKILDRVATQDDIKILDHVATQEDIKILEHVATKEDIQRQRVWILSGAIGVVFTLVLIGLGAYRIFVG